MLMPSVVGETVAATKRALRGNAKFLRGRIDAVDRRHAAECLVRHAATVPLLAVPPENGVIAVYYPIGGEMDTRLLVDWLRQVGWRIALPAVEIVDSPLIFREWVADAVLDRGAFGTYHPNELAARCVPHVILMPLLAFDADGHRLGYGGGYYDRTLAAMVEAGYRVSSLGVAFAAQEIEMVPRESWDRRLDMVLTERGVLPLRDGTRPRRKSGEFS
ncbi:MAG: 5-formyltetrahydrofolate cyclo-ligase [Rhodospirillaceae bacterium]|nr:5-formyltetrahydrofolate cyclo-ligase [Rhodospirillaceae bacterium]